MTNPRNASKIEKWANIAPKGAAVAINQGDRVKIVSNLALVTAAGTEDWFGVADTTSPVTSLGDQLTAIRVLQAGSECEFYLLSGTVNYNDAVYCDTDPQTVNLTNSNKLCGYVRNIEQVVGGAGVKVTVKICPTAAGADEPFSSCVVGGAATGNFKSGAVTISNAGGTGVATVTGFGASFKSLVTLVSGLATIVQIRVTQTSDTITISLFDGEGAPVNCSGASDHAVINWFAIKDTLT